MIRGLIWNLILVALPFALYWTYVKLVNWWTAQGGNPWSEAPIALLFMTGIALALASLFYLGVTDGTPPR